MPTMQDLIWAAAFAEAEQRNYRGEVPEMQAIDASLHQANRAVRAYETALIDRPHATRQIGEIGNV